MRRCGPPRCTPPPRLRCGATALMFTSQDLLDRKVQVDSDRLEGPMDNPECLPLWVTSGTSDDESVAGGEVRKHSQQAAHERYGPDCKEVSMALDDAIPPTGEKVG